MNYHALLSNFRSIIRQVVTYGSLKTKESAYLLALKVVAVAYERWLLTGCSKHSGLTWKRLVFWKIGRCGEVVTYEKWSQSEVRLYSLQTSETW